MLRDAARSVIFLALRQNFAPYSGLGLINVIESSRVGTPTVPHDNTLDWLLHIHS